jgi:hypothetical protein
VPAFPNHLPGKWQNQQRIDPDFVAASGILEIGYQVARLRTQSGLTHTCPGRKCRGAQLAEMVGTRQPSIAWLENGRSVPSLSFLDRIARRWAPESN